MKKESRFVDRENTMNNIDKASKDAKVLVDSAKDLATANLLNSVRSKSLHLDESTLQKVISIVNISVEEGYQRALPVYQNTLKRYISAT